jgi:hypothetical protein
MGKIVALVLVVVAVMLVLRLIGSAKRRVDDPAAGDPGGSRPGGGQRDRPDREERRDGGELMMSCSVCGVHVPASDAIFAHGKVFCSADHRDAAERHGE